MRNEQGGSFSSVKVHKGCSLGDYATEVVYND